MSATMVGEGNYRYEAHPDWAKLPRNLSFHDVPGLAADAKDNVYVFTRANPPILIFDREGNYVDSWGSGVFSVPHSVRVGPDGMVYFVDCGDHTVRKFASDGELLMTIGEKGKASDTGYRNNDFRTIARGAEPFNSPTDIAFGPSGDLYVSDGYGNARIHRFSRDGDLLKSWGEPGSEPGQFLISHGITIDRKKRILSEDRENSRIQLFTLEGEYLASWDDSYRPAFSAVDKDGAVFTTEMGYEKEMLYQFQKSPDGRSKWPRLTIRSEDGRIMAQLGGEDRCAPGNFFAPHGICVDSRGDVYVGEIISLGSDKNCHVVQKLVRKR